MKTKMGIFILMAAALLLTSCGKDSQSGTNEAAVSYFNSFLTHNETGERIGNDLALTTTAQSNSGSTLGFGSSYNTLGTQGQVFLRLFRNGTYALFSVNQAQINNEYYNNDNYPVNAISGNWRIEGNKIVLEGVGESQAFNSASVANGITSFDQNNCFLFTISESVAVPVNGQALGANNFTGSTDYLNPTNNNTLGFNNAYDVPMFCKQ